MAQNSITPIQGTGEHGIADRTAASHHDGRADQATKSLIIPVVDTSTKEVLQQWPPEYLLQIAAAAQKLTRDSG
jgi:FlaG protein